MARKISRHYEQVSQQIEDKKRNLGKVFTKHGKIYSFGDEGINTEREDSGLSFRWRKRYFTKNRGDYCALDVSYFLTHILDDGGVFQEANILNENGYLIDSQIPQFTNAVYSLEIFKETAGHISNIVLQCTQSIRIDVNGVAVHSSGYGPNTRNKVSISIPAKKWTKIDIYFYTGDSRIGNNFIRFLAPLGGFTDGHRNTKPPTPINFLASKGTIENSIKLSWESGDPLIQEFFQILYGETADEINNILEDGISSESREKIHSGLTLGVIYYYKIRSYTSDGDVSEFSDIVTGWASVDGVEAQLLINLSNNEFINDLPSDVPEELRGIFQEEALGSYQEEPINFSVRSVFPLEDPPIVKVSGYKEGEDDPLVPKVWTLEGSTVEPNRKWGYSFTPEGFYEGRIHILASLDDLSPTIETITYDKTKPIYGFTLDSDLSGATPDGLIWTRNSEIEIVPSSLDIIGDNDENAYEDPNDSTDYLRFIGSRHDWNVISGDVDLNSTHYWDGDIDDEIEGVWDNFVSISNSSDTLSGDQINLSYSLEVDDTNNNTGSFVVQVLLIEQDEVVPTKGIVRDSAEFTHEILYQITYPYEIYKYRLDSYSKNTTFDGLDPSKQYGVQIRLSQAEDIEGATDPYLNASFKVDTAGINWNSTGKREIPWDLGFYNEVGIESDKKYNGAIGDEIVTPANLGPLFKNDGGVVLKGHKMNCSAFLEATSLPTQAPYDPIEVTIQTLVCTGVGDTNWWVEDIIYDTAVFNPSPGFTGAHEWVLTEIDDLDINATYKTITCLYVDNSYEDVMGDMNIYWLDEDAEIGIGSIESFQKDEIPIVPLSKIDFYRYRKHVSGIMGIKVVETLHPEGEEDVEYPPVYFPYTKGASHEWALYPVDDPTGGRRTIEIEAFDRAGNWSDVATRSIYYTTGHIKDIDGEAVDRDYGKLVFHWNAISEEDAPELAGYKVWRKTNGSDPTEVEITGSLVATLYGRNNIEHTDCLMSRGGHLKPKTDYYYFVKGITHLGYDSEHYASANGQTLYAPPGVPTGVSLVPNEAKDAFIATFKPSSQDDGEFQDPNENALERRANKYHIYRCDITEYPPPENVEDKIEYITTVHHEGESDTEFDVSDIPPHRGYYYQYWCKAENAYGYQSEGYGHAPFLHTGERLSDGPPSPPVWDTELTTTSHEMIRLAWEGSLETDIIQYELLRNTQGTIVGGQTIATISFTPEQGGETLFYDDRRGASNLVANQDYYYWLRVINNADLSSEWGDGVCPLNPLQLDSTPPPIPILVENESYGWYGYNHITVSGYEDTTKLLEGYNIYRSGVDSDLPPEKIGHVFDNRTQGAKNVYFDTSPEPFVPYAYRATSINRYGDESNFSSPITLTMEPDYDKLFCNYLDNSSFERPVDPNFNWATTTPVVSDSSYHGKKCAEVERSNISSEKAIYSGYIFVQPQKEYTISFYAKKVAGAETAHRVCVFWYGPGRELIDSGVNTTINVSSENWERKHITVTSLNSAVSASIEFSVNTTAAGHVHFIDAVQWEEYDAEHSPRPYVETRVLSADRMQAHIIQGDMIRANSIWGDHIGANQISGEHILAGSITTDRLTVRGMKWVPAKQVGIDYEYDPLEGFPCSPLQDMALGNAMNSAAIDIYRGDIVIDGEEYSLHLLPTGYLMDPTWTYPEYTWNLSRNRFRLPWTTINNVSVVTGYKNANYYVGVIKNPDLSEYNNRLVISTSEDFVHTGFDVCLYQYTLSQRSPTSTQWDFNYNGTYGMGQTIIDGNQIKTGFLDANRIEAETINATHIAANQIKAKHIESWAIDTSKLTALSRNWVNNITSTNNLGGWGHFDERGVQIAGQQTQLSLKTWGELKGVLYCKTNVDGVHPSYNFISQPFEISNSEIYEVSVNVSKTVATGKLRWGACAWDRRDSNSNFHPPSTGLESATLITGGKDILLYSGGETAGRGYHGQSGTDGFVFYSQNLGNSPTSWIKLTSYLAGANVDVDSVPQPILSGGDYYYFGKFTEGTTHAAIRFDNWVNTEEAGIGIHSIVVTEVGSGKIVAENIFAKTLDADKLTISSDKSKVVINESGVTVGGNGGGKTILSNTDLTYVSPSNQTSKYPKRVEMYENIPCGVRFEFPAPFVSTPKITIMPGYNNLSYKPDSPWDTRNQYVSYYPASIDHEGFTPQHCLASGYSTELTQKYGPGSPVSFWVVTTNGWRMGKESVVKYAGAIGGTITNPEENYIPFLNNLSPTFPTISGTMFKVDGALTTHAITTKAATAIVQALLCEGTVGGTWTVRSIGYAPVPLPDMAGTQSYFSVKADGLDATITYRMQLRIYAPSWHDDDIDNDDIGATFGYFENEDNISPATIEGWKTTLDGAIYADQNSTVNAIVMESM